MGLDWNYFNPIVPFNQSFIGPPSQVYAARQGDVKHPRSWTDFRYDQLVDLHLEPVDQIGKSKFISYRELYTERKQTIRENRKYYSNNPPMINLDYEDPLADMTRIVYGIARECVLKGARFLVGKGRFDGVNSFLFPDATKGWMDDFNTTWSQNNLTQLVKSTSRTYLWAGDHFWKMQSMQQIQRTLGDLPTDPEEPLPIKQKVVDTQIRFTMCDPEHFHAVYNPYDKNHVICWVYQYETATDQFYREEIFPDSTLVYTGVRKKREEKGSTPVKDLLASIQGSGFFSAQLKNINDEIEYTLVDKIDYPELNEFPLVIWRNNWEGEAYGNSEFYGLHGKFDALNGLVTRSLYALDQMADPMLWLKGTTAVTTNMVKTPDGMWVFPEKDAQLNVLSWDGTPEAVFKMIDLIATQVYRTFGVPKSSEMKAFTNVSGDALNIINTDIIDATNDRRLDLEDGFKQIVKLIRKTFGYPKAIEEKMITIWGPVFPESVKDKNARLTTLAREKIIKRSRVIQLDDTIPSHLKDDMISEADTLEQQDRDDKLAAIDAQSQGSAGGGSGQAKRATQRATGLTKERGPGKPKL